MKRVRALTVLLAVATGAPPATAQDLFLSKRDGNVGARLVNVETPFTEGRGNLEVLFAFRMAETVQDGDVHDLWGIDSGADVGIALAFGVGSRFDLEVYRSSFQETFELAAKWRVLDPSRGSWFSAAVRAGADLVRASSVAAAERPFAQLLLSRDLGHGFAVFAAPSYVGDTPLLRDAFNVPVGLVVPFFGGAHIEVEVVPKVRDLDSSELGWQVALSKATAGHHLELTLGNTRALTLDQLLGGDFAGGFARDDVRLGINVSRYWRAR